MLEEKAYRHEHQNNIKKLKRKEQRIELEKWK